MKCVILAAGMAQRMRSLSGGHPKCLLHVGGKPVLQRTIENVLEAGIREVGIVVGYKADEVRRFVKEQFPTRRVRFMTNPRFESTNNAFSLLMAREYYKAESKQSRPSKKLLLLDSDIVFPFTLLPYLLQQDSPDCIAVRVAGSHDEEEIRVKVDSKGIIHSIGKHVPLGETYGESVGIEMFSPSASELLFDILEKRVREGKGRTEFYEASFQEMIGKRIEMKAVDVSKFPTIEIDTPEDLEEAQKLVAGKIS
ncbi:MAG: phosphocholine cytidylyltransferase family protein [Bacteroidota bacterium]